MSKYDTIEMNFCDYVLGEQKLIQKYLAWTKYLQKYTRKGVM